MVGGPLAGGYRRPYHRRKHRFVRFQSGSHALPNKGSEIGNLSPFDHRVENAPGQGVDSDQEYRGRARIPDAPARELPQAGRIGFEEKLEILRREGCFPEGRPEGFFRRSRHIGPGRIAGKGEKLLSREPGDDRIRHPVELLRRYYPLEVGWLDPVQPSGFRTPREFECGRKTP